MSDEKKYPPTLAGTVMLYSDRSLECIHEIQKLHYIDTDGFIDMDTVEMRQVLIHVANAKNWLDGIEQVIRS